MFKNTVNVMLPTSLVSGLGALDLRVSWGEPGNGPAGMGVGDVVGVLEAVRGGATAAAVAAPLSNCVLSRTLLIFSYHLKIKVI